MRHPTMSERAMATVAHLITLVALVPYCFGLTLIPAGPVWFVGLGLTLVIALFSWKRSTYVRRHSTLAVIGVLAGWIPELLGVPFFVVATLLGVRFNMTNGTLLEGAFAGQNPETLIRVTLAPFILAIPCFYAVRAIVGKEPKTKPSPSGEGLKSS